MESKERILCAAIWYKDQKTAICNPINVDKGVVVCGHRHPHCIYAFKALTGLRTVTPECGIHVQGFLTSNNRFVDRKEAMIIALQAQQVVAGKTYHQISLFSEDLY